MTRNYWLQNHSQTHWQSITTDFNAAPAHTLSWLNHKDSLTARLRQNCSAFHVEVLNEELSPADANEAALITGTEQAPLWVREVYLYGDNQPWVYARSSMPANTSSQLAQIKQLHQKPLGEMLFSSPDLHIHERLVAEFQPTAQLNPGQNPEMTALWGRRTLFRIGNFPLVVTEIFLPGSPAYR
ncbi:chorismate--pyruvate lyase family protein [Reinekea marinisedimentorum]|uniref:Probable chorismate pyruvate-lyase n=1 Tax=Reinekea marinisedimentorum TaxID=230495 RepID=A0A4R3HSJ6_9GAMM|nr:chorismate lyase [Reinekea marinisedimentorum]TCS35918.1 chorismate--pyruvate lyase [Reinekea marinisedimentorum]